MACLTVGLDLGQAQDFTALVVVERVVVLPVGVTLAEFHRAPQRVPLSEIREEHHVLALKRWELGTTYTDIVRDLARVFENDELNADANLVVDRSGVGRAVVNWIQEGREQFGRLWSCASFVTVAAEGRNSKTNLVDALALPLEQGRVKVPASLLLAPAMEKELTSFTRKVTEAGNTTFGFSRSGEGHGDLVSALMLALHKPNWLRTPQLVENMANATNNENAWSAS